MRPKGSGCLRRKTLTCHSNDLTSAEPSTKPCSKCGERKPRSSFYPRSRNPASLSAHCKKCMNAARSAWGKANRQRTYDTKRARKYGVTPEKCGEMLRKQGGGCAICRTGVPGGTGTWNVDHDHGSGATRGLLCISCNLGLGHFRDDPRTLQQAIEYLNIHRTP